MLKNLKSLLFILLFSVLHSAYSQGLTGYELGILVGPVQMRSDFGLRGDQATNQGNIGFGAGIMLDLNPMDWGNRREYVYDHFKIRFDLSYNKTNLKHYGEFVADDKTSENADKLRAQTGEAKNVNLGVGLEYYPLSLRDFFYEFIQFSPYAILGIQYTHARPGSNITNEDQLYGPWANKGSINVETFTTFGVNVGGGVRYKVNEYSDFLVEIQWHFFNSDWVDGLNHPFDYNENKDSLIWINFGYVYYLN